MLELVLSDGAKARVDTVDGERVVLVAPRPAPPGSPLAASSADNDYQFKVRGCRRDPDGAYRIECRCVNLTRAGRDELASA